MFMRHFTLDEASMLLPVAQEACQRVRALLAEHDSLRATAPGGQGFPGVQQGEVLAERMESIHDEVATELAGLQQLGVQVKSLEPMLLDFPAILAGQPVLLCWREGEPAIQHIHPVVGGFNARRPILAQDNFGTTPLQ